MGFLIIDMRTKFYVTELNWLQVGQYPPWLFWTRLTSDCKFKFVKSLLCLADTPKKKTTKKPAGDGRSINQNIPVGDPTFTDVFLEAPAAFFRASAVLTPGCGAA